MTVVFDDMGLKYLDKNVVLLKNQHLTNENLTDKASVRHTNERVHYCAGWVRPAPFIVYVAPQTISHDFRNLTIFFNEYRNL